MKKSQINTRIKEFEAAVRAHEIKGDPCLTGSEKVIERLRIARKRLKDDLDTLYFELKQSRNRER